MSSFNCPRCSKTFVVKGAWVYHLEHKHGVAPVATGPTVAGRSLATTSGPSMSTASTPSADDINPAVGRFNLRPKVSFHVAYDLGRGDEAQPIRVTVPKDESYDKFLWRLYNVFYGDSFEKSLRQWEYVLVNRQYERGDPLPLTSPNTYYAMVSELLRARSQWRHAVVRRSHSENPIIKAIVEGTYNPKPDSPILNAATPDPRLPDSPPIPDASIADTPMPDAPTDQATPELLASTPPSRAWVVTSATARPSNRTPSPGPPSRAYPRELSTPSTPVTSARGRRLLQLSSPLAPAAGARSPTRFNLPLISSPLRPVSSDGGRRSMRLGSPVASVTSASKPSQVSSPIAPVTSASLPSQLGPPLAPVTSAQSPNLLDSSPLASQSPATLLGSITSPATGAPIPSIQLGPPSVPAASARRASIHLNSPSIQLSLPIIPTTSAPTPPAVLPIVSSPLPPQDPGSEVDLGEPNSRLAPALIAPHPPATPPIASGSRSSRTPVPELFQRSLNLPPRSTPASIPSIQAPPTAPTAISRPRRPLWIISRQRLNSVTEYHVHWNNGSRAWEPHDSLYRDYPAFVDRYLEGRR